MSDVIIVGGGLIGLLSARELALAGLKVTVLERGEAGRESSWAGGGILSPLYPWRYPDAVNRLACWGQPRYRQLAEALQRSTAIDPQWRQSGLLITGLDSAEQETARRWAARFDSNLSTPTPKEVHDIEPAIATVEGAVWLPEVGQMRNPRLMQALQADVSRLGVTLRLNTEVTAFELSAGRVTAVVTTDGKLPCHSVVVAAGAWSAAVLERLGLALPVEPVKGQMLLYRASPELLQRIVLHQGHYFIPRRDGHILVGSTMEYVGFNKETTQTAEEELHGVIREVMPQLLECEQERHWAGLRPGIADGIPLIGPVEGIDGLYLNTGHFRNGVVMGFASARLLASLMLQQSANVPPEEYLPTAVRLRRING